MNEIDVVGRKVDVSVFASAEWGCDQMVVAWVKNAGPTPLVITRVAFEYDYEHAEDVLGTWDGHKHCRGIEFLPKEGSKASELQPGEEREYHLPRNLNEDVALLAVGLLPAFFWVAVYSGMDEVGRATGDAVQPSFKGALIVFHRRAMPIFDTLPEEEQLAIHRAMLPLLRLESDQWPSVGAQLLNGPRPFFFVQVNDDLGVIVRKTDNKKLEVEDIVRKSILDQVLTLGGSAKQ
jgi:hypothetical protein